MIIKAKTTFNHGGQAFLKGVVYDVNDNDANYFIATAWAVKSKETAVLTVGELGVDPNTKWAKTGKKVLSH